MANQITKTTLHPEGDDTIDLYPKTSVDQVEGLYSTIRSIGVGFHPMGDWVSGHVYVINDVVTYNESSYLCRANVTSTTPPPDDEANWQISGGAGPQGEQGIQGIQGETGATGATPNITANVEVGNTTGIPSATVERSGTNENPVLTFSFNNLKGEQGIQGETGVTGATPNITANVEVNNTTGTPSATVERSGTNEAPILTFSFKNLKGEQGAQGIQGDSLNPMGAWVANNEYHPNDLVTYGASSYYCTNAISGSSVPPDQDTTHWAISAQGGVAENGLPTGGTTGQILSKKSNANYDAEWVDKGKVYLHNISFSTVTNYGAAAKFNSSGSITLDTQSADIDVEAQFYSSRSTPVTTLEEIYEILDGRSSVRLLGVAKMRINNIRTMFNAIIDIYTGGVGGVRVTGCSAYQDSVSACIMYKEAANIMDVSITDVVLAV